MHGYAQYIAKEQAKGAVLETESRLIPLVEFETYRFFTSIFPKFHWDSPKFVNTTPSMNSMAF